MKATGIVRNIDELGRIVIPKELRRTRGLTEGTPMEIYVEDEKIIIQKYSLSCTFCGCRIGQYEFSGRRICDKCMEKIKKLEVTE